MADANIYQIYEEHIAPLPVAEQLRLAALIAGQLANKRLEAKPGRSILELEGLGAENPVGMDAQEYVRKLREEWDHRP